jgi:hypothetical protein
VAKAAAFVALVLPVLKVSARLMVPLKTIVFVRHGEKPQGGFGQLNCQGLNRALRR